MKKLFGRIRPGLLFASAASFLWAGSIVNTRYVLSQGEHPLNLEAWISIFLLIPWLFIFHKRTSEFISLSARNKWMLVGIGIAVSVGLDYLQALALANTTAVNFSFLYRTVTVFTIILAYIFFKEPITPKKGVLTAGLLIGAYLFTTNGQRLVLTSGDIYTLLYAISAAFIANILIKHTISKMHPDVSASGIGIVAAITLVLLSMIRGVFHVPALLPLIVLGALISLGTTLARNRAYKHATASFVSMVFTLNPVFVALLSYPFLHEQLSTMEIVGGACIVGTTLLVEKFKI